MCCVCCRDSVIFLLNVCCTDSAMVCSECVLCRCHITVCLLNVYCTDTSSHINIIRVSSKTKTSTSTVQCCSECSKFLFLFFFFSFFSEAKERHYSTFSHCRYCYGIVWGYLHMYCTSEVYNVPGVHGCIQSGLNWPLYILCRFLFGRTVWLCLLAKGAALAVPGSGASSSTDS